MRATLIAGGLVAALVLGLQTAAQAQQTGPTQQGADLAGSVGNQEGTNLAGSIADATSDAQQFLQGTAQQDGFVGANADEVFNPRSQGGSDVRTAQDSLRQGRGTQFNNSGQKRTTRTEVRSVLRIAFSVPARSFASAGTSQAFQVRGLTRIQASSPVKVSVDRGIATLSGVVATAHDRALAEQLVLLEGGISTVKNQLEVAGAAPVPTSN